MSSGKSIIEKATEYYLYKKNNRNDKESAIERTCKYLASKCSSNSEWFSKEEDCYILAKELKKILENKIDFYGSIRTPIPSGKYLSSYRKNNGEHMFNGHCLPFYFKFSNNEFLRIGVGANYSCNSFEEKLAALSAFYEILRKKYGEPIVFYTTKNDDKGLLNLQWSFINKDKEIEKFKSGTYFDDTEIETLIVIGEKKENVEEYSMNDKQREIISRKVGLPLELLDLLDDNQEEYFKHKKGKEIAIPVGAKVDGYPLVSFEKKLEKKIKRL